MRKKIFIVTYFVLIVTLLITTMINFSLIKQTSNDILNYNYESKEVNNSNSVYPRGYSTHNIQDFYVTTEYNVCMHKTVELISIDLYDLNPGFTLYNTYKKDYLVTPSYKLPFNAFILEINKELGEIRLINLDKYYFTFECSIDDCLLHLDSNYKVTYDKNTYDCKLNSVNIVNEMYIFTSDYISVGYYSFKEEGILKKDNTLLNNCYILFEEDIHGFDGQYGYITLKKDNEYVDIKVRAFHYKNSRGFSYYIILDVISPDDIIYF